MKKPLAPPGFDLAQALTSMTKDLEMSVKGDISATKRLEQWRSPTTAKGKCAFRKLHPVGNGRHLGYPLKRTMALAGYLIKPRAAKQLCARLRNVREPVDIALCRHWEWDDMRLSVRPHPVRHDENETTIADRGETGAQRKIHHQLCGGIINTPEWCRRIFHYCAIRSAK